jgi:2-methylcitrate dehydratase PrpD
MSETAAMATAITSIDYDDVPDPVLAKAKGAILDYVGVALYGSHHEVGNIVTDYVTAIGGSGETPMLGRKPTGSAGAALANGTFGHAIDYDDTFESLVLHPTSPTFAAAHAATAVADADGRSLLTGYVVGIETAYRVGQSVYPSHYEHGWHITGTAGTFGATASVASILDLSTEAVEHALGIAASSSSSLKKNFGSMTKPLHAGHAAQSGLRAALLASQGFTADPEILDGQLGYGAVMTPDGSYDPAPITDPEDGWAVMDIGYKPYPSGVITHAAMDALRELVEEEGLTPDDVASIVVTLDEAASEMLHHHNPENALQAKFSIEFCLAAILRERTVGLLEFTDEYVTESETRDVIDFVDRDFEANLFEGPYANYGARVTVTTEDGRELVATERFAPGSPNNPISEDRLEGKFREAATTVLDENDVDAVAEAIDTLERTGSLGQLNDAVTK